MNSVQTTIKADHSTVSPPKLPPSLRSTTSDQHKQTSDDDNVEAHSSSTIVVSGIACRNMGANSSPSASDAVANSASFKTKKRKTSDAPLPINLSAPSSSSASPAESAADSNNAGNLHTEATLERMATALDLSQSFLDRALLDQTLPKSTSLAMEDSQSRLQQLALFVDALRSADIDGVALQLQRMFVSDTGVLSTLRDATDRVLSHANANDASNLITRARRISSAASNPLVPTEIANNANKLSIIPSNNANNSNEPQDVDMEEEERQQDASNPRASLHEAQAAQALTGLRQSASGPGSSVAAAAAAAVAAVMKTTSPNQTQTVLAPPMLPTLSMPLPSPRHHQQQQQQPTPKNASNNNSNSSSRDRSAIPSSVPYNPLGHPPTSAAALPSMSPTHALSIFAPQPSDMAMFVQQQQQQQQQLQQQNGGGLFIMAPSPTTAMPSPMATPGGSSQGGLPSIFSRGLLAPIASPYGNGNGNGSGNGSGDHHHHHHHHGVSVYATSPLVATTCTPMMSHLSPFVDWKNLTPSPPNSSSHMAPQESAVSSPPAEVMMMAMMAQASSNMAAHTPVHATGYRSSPQLENSSSQASPVKRKSLAAAKQAAANAASAAAAIAVAEAAATHVANLTLPIAKSLAALERTHPTRKANPRRWTKEEDDALRQAVENHKEKNWKAIASQVPGRNHTQCLQRWTKVLAPGLVKGHWSPHEDELLKRLVAGGNKNWGEVAGKIPGRTSKQCRERWHNHLDPNIVRGAYSPEEDRIILEAQARLGNRWSVIAAMLPGRTEDAVKIRWKSHCRLWKARKYLRKTGGGGTGGAEDFGSGGGPSADDALMLLAGADDDMDGEGEDDAEDDEDDFSEDDGEEERAYENEKDDQRQQDNQVGPPPPPSVATSTA